MDGTRNEPGGLRGNRAATAADAYPSAPVGPRWLTVEEAAVEARISVRTLYRLLRAGDVIGTRARGKRLVDGSSLLAYLLARATP